LAETLEDVWQKWHKEGAETLEDVWQKPLRMFGRSGTRRVQKWHKERVQKPLRMS